MKNKLSLEDVKGLRSIRLPFDDGKYYEEIALDRNPVSKEFTATAFMKTGGSCIIGENINDSAAKQAHKLWMEDQELKIVSLLSAPRFNQS